jgi:lipoprotein-anchoring transpeptidase ErfK/SrfK
MRGHHVMRFLALTFFVVSMLLHQPAASMAATLVAKVTLSTQTMTVMHNGRVIHTWKVSTARRGKVTPVGSWRPQWLSRHHRSSRYNNAPMPYSIFYHGHYAVHGTDQISRLGTPASAGCIRLHPDNAARLFGLVQKVGLGNTRIVVQR